MKIKRQNHGLSDTKFYFVWAAMKDRCLNQRCTAYKYYGARGITLSKKWLRITGFAEDMLFSYLEHIQKYGGKNTSLERIDVNGGYNKKNCKWATIDEQQRNKNSNVYLIVNGKKYIQADLAKLFNKTPAAFNFYIKKYGKEIFQKILEERLVTGWKYKHSFTKQWWKKRKRSLKGTFLPSTSNGSRRRKERKNL